MENCVICNKKIVGFSNNPFPVRKNGVCCGKCNSRFVIPIRVGLIDYGNSMSLNAIVEKINNLSYEELDKLIDLI